MKVSPTQCEAPGYTGRVKRPLPIVIAVLVSAVAGWSAWCVLSPPVMTVHVNGDSTATFTSRWADVSGAKRGRVQQGPAGTPPSSFEVAGNRVKIWVTKTGPGMFRVDGDDGKGGGTSSMLEGDLLGDVGLELGSAAGANFKLWGGNAVIVLLGVFVTVGLRRRERTRIAQSD